MQPDTKPFTPKDQQARDLASIPAAHNVIVEAGAGTGKTTILIERMCYLILGKDIPIDKIVALTFTEKAAAEIKIRLLAQMQKILKESDNPSTTDRATLTLLNRFKKTKEELQKSVQESFELAERAQISTIHSFCLQILRRFPLEANLAPQAQVDDGTVEQNIFDKAWSSFLEEELIFNAPSAKIWKELLESVSLEDIKEFAKTLLTPSLESYHPFKDFKTIKPFCLSYAAKARDLAQRYPVPRKRAMEPTLLEAASMLEESATFLDSLKPVKSKYNIEKMPSCPSNWEEEDYETAKDIINFATSLKVDNQLLLMQAFNLVNPFIKDIKEELRKENIISYDNLIEKTKELLKTDNAVRGELKKEYRSILIDEFQDTDPAQGEILLFLAEEESTFAPSWQDVKLEQGKLFTVGDPKQSIYRFRGADITAYEKFTDLMFKQRAAKSFLQTNFRSSKNIITFANTFGEKMIQEKKGIQPKYVAIDNGKDFEAPQVEIAAIESGEETKPDIDSYRHNQAQYIAAWIKDNAFKTKLSNGKIMTYKDIAILLRTTTALDIYTDALKRFDIKYTVEETKNFYNAQEIADLINILKVINDPLDKAALVGVLRSPFAMLTDNEILQLSSKNALNILSDVSFAPKAAHFYKILKDLHLKAGKVPLGALLGEIIYNTSFIEAQTLATQKEQTIANIFKFISVLRTIHGRGALSLGQFLYYAENYSKEQKKEGESPLAEESLDTVSIMTMHKSKGLEFPVVILSDISKKERLTKAKRPQYIYSWEQNIQGLRLGAMPDAAFSYLEQSAKEHSKAEELRILYVALTRAKEQLILAGDLKDEEDTISSALQKAGCWPNAKLKPQILEQQGTKPQIAYIKHQNPELFTDKEFAKNQQQNVALDIPLWLEAWQKRSQAYDQITQKAAKLAPSAHGQKEEAPFKKDSAAIVGTLCHRMLLNILTGNKKSAAQSALVENIDPFINSAEIDEAQKIINNFTQSAVFKKLSSMRLLAAETPFTITGKNETIISGIIDAVFETPQGDILVADYKSDNIEISQIQKRSAFYKQQLDFYKEALQQMFKDKKIEAAVIYLRPALEHYI